MVLGKHPVALERAFSTPVDSKSDRGRQQSGGSEDSTGGEGSSGRNLRGRDLDSQSWVWINMDRGG